MTPQDIKTKTDSLQSLASRPGVSAWVSANAGTGKTYVLVQRVLRLLLSGTEPERILCLTFTKAAASEMANRLFDKLSQWATAKDDELDHILTGLLKQQPTKLQKQDARRLFARALETPGGLKVQTIHAFCERLLQRFPLEANVAPHFSVLDDAAQKELLLFSQAKILSQAARDHNSPLGKALRHVIAYAGQDRFDDILRGVLDHRDALADTINQALMVVEDINQLSEGLRLEFNRALGLSPALTEDKLLAEVDHLISDFNVKNAVHILQQGKTTDQKLADHLSALDTASGARITFDLMARAFLTAKGEPRSDRFITKQIKDDHPGLAARLSQIRDETHRISLSLEGLRIVDASRSLVLLADKIMQDYERAKIRQAVLDFDDLILKTSNLLGRSDAASWVLYKLDGGIDHILVDEAQDTSPKSWTVIQYLAEEFFSGQSARENLRTVFAVGDEKQSIYGFQGAEPKKFAHMGHMFEQRASHAPLEWHRIPLTLSFRSTAPVLQAVDYVFSQNQALKGLTAEDTTVKHAAYRDGQSGHVEIWETEKSLKEEPSDPWVVSEESVTDTPIIRLANRIAETIKEWLERGEILQTRGTPIRPGDILILVRKREPFVAPMIRALKARDIPVAGADRIRITEQLAVMDLLALGDFLLMPEDDLSLATVLKSPFFDFTDDDLFAIACDRRASLWEALNKRTDLNPAYEEAAVVLRQWLARADLAPPFEFFSGVLITRERRARMISRLGLEAGDAIDEFLNMAIQYDDMASPSLQGFLSWIKQSDTEIKRDMEQGRNEVRIMTVHGAKGLEAEIVFLPDTCSRRSQQTSASVLALTQSSQTMCEDLEQKQVLWAIPGSGRQDVVIQAREANAQAEQEEYHRLLYVAMTRARDRLYIAGFENKKGRDAGCWYDLMYQGMAAYMTQTQDNLGNSVLILTTPQDQPPDRTGDETVPQDVATEPPDWAFRRAPAEPVRSIPVSPSSLIPLDTSEMSELDLGDQPAISPRGLAHEHRFLRGLITHALLEHLPHMDPLHWEEAANKFVAVRAKDASKSMQDSIVWETLRILQDPEFGQLFGPKSQAEVSVTAKIPESETGGAPVLVSGQIDRLIILDHDIFFIDYKTNRPPPSQPEAVAPAYLAQLVAYRRALNDIMPGKSVRCALLWTDGPHLMEIPSRLLDNMQAELHQNGWRRS